MKRERKQYLCPRVVAVACLEADDQLCKISIEVSDDEGSDFSEVKGAMDDDAMWPSGTDAWEGGW